LVVLRARRGVVAAAALVAFNLLMFVLAAIGSDPMETPFLVAWITGDALDPGDAGAHRMLVTGGPAGLRGFATTRAHGDAVA
jgi:hypothetical protein